MASLSSGPSTQDLQTSDSAKAALNDPGLLEGGEGAVLVDGLEGLAGGFDPDPAIQFGNKNPLGMEIGADLPLHGLGDVAANPAFFLGETGTVDFAAHVGAGTSDTTDTCHDMKIWGAGRGGKPSSHGWSRFFEKKGDRLDRFPEFCASVARGSSSAQHKIVYVYDFMGSGGDRMTAAFFGGEGGRLGVV